MKYLILIFGIIFFASCKKETSIRGTLIKDSTSVTTLAMSQSTDTCTVYFDSTSNICYLMKDGKAVRKLTYYNNGDICYSVIEIIFWTGISAIIIMFFIFCLFFDTITNNK